VTSEPASKAASAASSSNDSGRPGADYFATTRWTVVLAAGQNTRPQARRALEELCRIYWYPLYVYVRRQGHSKEDAEDLTQGFFARFLEANYLDKVNSEKGRFRAFLLASFKHFLANEYDRANRQKRGGGQKVLSLDWQDADNRYRIDPADEVSPDKLYDRAWAVTLLECVLARLRDESARDGKLEQFLRLRPFLMLGKSAVRYAETAADMNVTQGALRVTVHRLRRRYRELLVEEISQTLSDTAMATEEIKALFNAVAD
jgi:RNA polymerase sigma factor (sigma-70 family)